MYIYDREGWPSFHWNDGILAESLVQVRYQQGRLIGGMGSLGIPLREETVLQTLTQDVVKSSEIEGEILSPSSVRSSVARHLGMDHAALGPADRHVEGVVEMMLDATQQYDQPLTKERLFCWHASLFLTGRSGFAKIQVGGWRSGPVQVISGHMGKETLHYGAPAADRVDQEMARFLAWINSESNIDPVLKAALAHLWFVTLHPFDDGNGRIARAIADMMLARSEGSPWRFYSMSAQIQKERRGYYAVLEKTQKGELDITPWIEWFLNCLGRAIEEALSALSTVLNKGHFWDRIRELPLNERQHKVLNRLLDDFDGKLTSSKWAKIAKCSQDTAYRDILDLIARGILTKNEEGGRSTSYSLLMPPPTDIGPPTAS